MSPQSKRNVSEQLRYNDLAERALEIVNQNDAVRAQRERDEASRAHRVGMSAYAVATRHLNRMHREATGDLLGGDPAEEQRVFDETLLNDPPPEIMNIMNFLGNDGFVLVPSASGLRRELQNPNGPRGLGHALAGVMENIQTTTDLLDDANERRGWVRI